MTAESAGQMAFPRSDAARQDIAELFESLSNWGRWGADDELGR